MVIWKKVVLWGFTLIILGCLGIMAYSIIIYQASTDKPDTMDERIIKLESSLNSLQQQVDNIDDRLGAIDGEEYPNGRKGGSE